MINKLPIRHAVRVIFWGVHLGSLVLVLLAYLHLPDYAGHAFVGSIALIAIFNNTKINTRRATLEIFLRTISDSDLIKDQNMIRGKKFDTDRVANIVAGKGSELNPAAKEEEIGESEALMRVLNHFEFMALGAKRRALDYHIMHELQHSNIKRYWDTYSSIIAKIRGLIGSDTIFQELECLASEFENHKLDKRRK